MKPFRYVFYGLIDITLSGHMHIGGEEDDPFAMAVDGNGNYVIPAGTVAGVLRSGLADIGSERDKLFGDKDSNSRLWFYDAVLANTSVERRMGVCIDPDMGTVIPKKLYSRFYLGDGATTTLKIQGFAETEKERDKLLEAVQIAVSRIAQGIITFGSKRSTGAGTVRVTNAKYQILDLHEEKELNAYLSGVEACFASCNLKLETMETASGSGIGFVLKANVPAGILVASGEKATVSDKVNLVRKKNKKDIPFIPGTTIKGMLRAYAEKVCKAQGLDQRILVEMFGGELDDKHIAGFVKTEDADFNHPSRLVYNRIQIDRWLGGTITGKKMNAELIGNDTIELKVWVSDGKDAVKNRLARALVFLALRDAGTGRISIGSGDAIGWGRLEGVSLSFNDKVCRFSENPSTRVRRIEADDATKAEVMGWLQEMEVKANADEEQKQ